MYCATSVWGDSRLIKTQADLSSRTHCRFLNLLFQNKRLHTAETSGHKFNCLPCYTSSLALLISPEKKKRAALTESSAGNIGIQFCRKQPFYHSGQTWDLCRIKKTHLKIQPPAADFFFFPFFSSSSFKIQVPEVTKSQFSFVKSKGMIQGKSIFLVERFFYFLHLEGGANTSCFDVMRISVTYTGKEATKQMWKHRRGRSQPGGSIKSKREAPEMPDPH